MADIVLDARRGFTFRVERTEDGLVSVTVLGEDHEYARLVLYVEQAEHMGDALGHPESLNQPEIIETLEYYQQGFDDEGEPLAYTVAKEHREEADGMEDIGSHLERQADPAPPDPAEAAVVAAIGAVLLEMIRRDPDAPINRLRDAAENLGEALACGRYAHRRLMPRLADELGDDA